MLYSSIYYISFTYLIPDPWATGTSKLAPVLPGIWAAKCMGPGNLGRIPLVLLLRFHRPLFPDTQPNPLLFNWNTRGA